MKPDVLLPERHEPPRLRDWDVRLLLLKVFIRLSARAKNKSSQAIDR
jgi:hypothetical protein